MKYEQLPLPTTEQLLFLLYTNNTIMINIEQFRIGNYLLVDNQLRKICSLNSNGNGEEKLIGFEIADDVEYENPSSIRLKNVKITDQLLIDLGFSYHSHFKLWQHQRPDRTYSIELDNDYFPLDFSHQPIVQHMTYLHQLQNLFFIIQGEELAFDKNRVSSDNNIHL